MRIKNCGNAQQENQEARLRTWGTLTIHMRGFGDVNHQIPFLKRDCEALDRIFALNGNDVLLCETSCLDYVFHVFDLENCPKEVWVIPPLEIGVRPDEELLDDFKETICGVNQDASRLFGGGNAYFKGLTCLVPDRPFKLLITTQFCGVPIDEAINWPKYNSFWIDMLNTESATGAVIYPSAREQGENNPSLREGVFHTEGFRRVAELSNGRIVLGLGAPDAPLVMEDLSNTEHPWMKEITLIERSVNDGSLVPSMYRTGIKVIEETTLGNLASRISRGTSLRGKDLDVAEKLDAKVIGMSPAPSLSSPGNEVRKANKHRAFSIRGGIHNILSKSYCAYKDDFFFIDDSCFNKGEIWPQVLASIPEGQGRYVVDENDGEVLLVSRNSKQIAVYEAFRPTLIANSVFVIRLASDVGRDYLACWLRGSYAQDRLRNEGKVLSKAVLSSLPVPILEDDTMAQVVNYEKSIDKKIFDLQEEVEKLKASNRFAPLAAMKEADSR